MSLVPAFPISLSASALAHAFMDELYRLWSSFEESLVRSVMADVLHAASTSADINPNGDPWLDKVGAVMLPVAKFAVAPLLFAATIGAILRQDMRRLGRAWGVALPLALIGGSAAISLTYYGLRASDAISRMVQNGLEPNLEKDFLSAVVVVVPSSAAMPAVGSLLSLLLIGGAVIIWLELAVRSAAIELAVFFMPLALAGLVWPSTAHWAKRTVELLVALLLAKPVIVCCLCLGLNAITSAQASSSSVVTGAAILFMAAFAPVALLKLVPMVEISAVSHLHDISQQPVRAAGRAVQWARAAGTTAATGAPAPPESLGAATLLGRMGNGPAGSGGSGGGAGSGADDPLGPARNPGPSRPPLAAPALPAPSSVGG